MKTIYLACTTVLVLCNAALAADNGGPWTHAQVKKLCYSRAAGAQQSAKHFDRCMKRNVSKIGKQKHPGEMTELNAADADLDKKAATTKETK